MTKSKAQKKNNYRLYINNNLVLNSKIGAINWSNNINGLSTVLNFSSLLNISVGSKFLLMNDSIEIVRGMITDKNGSKSKIRNYIGFDYGFHINKNEVTRQFNGAAGDVVIKQLLSSVNIPYGVIDKIPIRIKEIYKKKTVASIIEDILTQVKEKTEIRYLLKVKQGKINIQKFKEINISNLEYYLSEREKRKIIDAIGDFSSSESIQELKNRVLIIKDEGKKGSYIMADVKDNESIKEYGLLQMIESYDKENKQSSKTIAQNILKQNNKITKKVGINMLGVDEAVSGNIIVFDANKHNLKGKFLINNDSHTVSSNNNHKMDLELEYYV